MLGVGAVDEQPCLYLLPLSQMQDTQAFGSPKSSSWGYYHSNMAVLPLQTGSSQGNR